jgi:hypothetical protein
MKLDFRSKKKEKAPDLSEIKGCGALLVAIRC